MKLEARKDSLTKRVVLVGAAAEKASDELFLSALMESICSGSFVELQLHTTDGVYHWGDKDRKAGES